MQINNNFQKNANISMVAQLLWKVPGISRVEIARRLDLYRSTVSNIINTLIENKVVFEEKEGEAMPQGGRKPIFLGLNERFGCVLGLEFQPSGYHAVVLNVFGTVLYSESGELPDLPFNETVESVIEKVMPSIASSETPLLGICVGIPGIVDSVSGRVIKSDPFHLKNHDFSKTFSGKYRVPVLLENDANCLAWYELAGNRGNDLKNFVCLNTEYQTEGARFGETTGMSVGIGVAIGGAVYAGSKHAAGEFVSQSWRSDSHGQTGLSPDRMRLVRSDPEAFAEWTCDLFASFLPIVAVLDPEAVFIHGELARKSDAVKALLAGRVPQFGALLSRTGCELRFGDGDDYSVAAGAAQMFYMNLFSVPACSNNELGTAIDWDSVFEITARSRV